MGTWTFNLLGGFSITAPDGARIALPGKKHQALMALLVSSREGTVTRARLMELLWSYRSDGQARASLRGVLSEIRSALKRYPDPPLAADRNRIYLANVPIEVDVNRLDEAIRASTLEQLQAAADLYAGDFLATLRIKEELFLEWREREQFRIRKTFSRVLTKLLWALWDNEAYRDRIEEVANRLLAINAADEDAHRSLMLLYVRQGKQLLALEQFKICQRKLRGIGASPSPETVELFESIRAASGRERPRAESLIAFEAADLPSSAPSREAFGTSVAVTPFTCGEGSSAAAGHGELLAEEIIAAAARFKWFRVVPRSESFNGQLHQGGPLKVAQATGAKYVLEGRFRRTEEGNGLFVELVDCAESNTVWTGKLDVCGNGSRDREAIVAKLAAQLEQQLRTSEIEQAHRWDRDNLSSYECMLLAISNMYDMRLANYEDAERLFETAVTRKPDHSSVYSFWSLWKIWCFGQGWADDNGTELAEAGRLAKKALERDPSDPLALAISGHFESFCNKDFEQGEIQFDKSLARNPYSSFAWMLSSATYSYRGLTEEALRRLERADTLCSVGPHFEFMYNSARCIAYIFGQDFERARAWGQKTIYQNGGFTNGYKQLLVALGHLEQRAECRKYLDKLLKLEPDFNIRSFIGQYPIARERDKQIFIEGLTKAGVPPEGRPKRPRLSVVDRGVSTS